MRKNQRFNQHIIGRSGRVSDRRHRKTVACRGFRPLCGSSVLSCTASANRMQRAPARGRAGDRPKPPRPATGSSKHSSGKPVRRPPFPPRAMRHTSRLADGCCRTIADRRPIRRIGRHAAHSALFGPVRNRPFQGRRCFTPRNAGEAAAKRITGGNPHPDAVRSPYPTVGKR